MKQLIPIIILVICTTQVYSAPQFVSFKDGKLGVNFGGYHAAVGIGGLLGQSGGAGGGLFAEAGTPHGQAAKAGLGGAVDGSGISSGGLYAGATAGGNVKASAGLAGGMTAEKSAGSGYAAAQAGGNYAASGLGGEASDAGTSGYTFSGSKSFGVSKGVVPVEVQPIQAGHKKVHKEFNVDANELNFVPISSQVGIKSEVQPQVIVKEVHVQSPSQVIEKHIVHKHNKPHHHLRKTAYFGGYIGGDSGSNLQAQTPIQKRIDVNVGAANTGFADAEINGNTAQTYNKQVTFQRNPNFFADIFNIPISTLKAVGNFLGNTAGSTSVSVQKSGSVHADTDTITPKHAATSVSSSEVHNINVQTPNVSKVIDDILAIPINTLGAVNKFLENNVPARKTLQVGEDGARQWGPHARRRANKQVVIVQENVQSTKTEESSS